MQIDRARFLALAGALATSCAAGATPPKSSSSAAPSAATSGSASATASPSASSARPPPAVAGPHIRPGPCVEGGAQWANGVTCDDKPYEVDCARLAPPPVCRWATKLQQRCERYAKLVRPAAAAMWIEGYECLLHGDRLALCKWQDADLSPAEVTYGPACRRADEVDVCTRLARSCVGLPASHPPFVEACKAAIGTLTDAGVARVDACLKKSKSCGGPNVLRECVAALGSPDDD